MTFLPEISVFSYYIMLFFFLLLINGKDGYIIKIIFYMYISDCRKTCNVPQIGLGVLNSSTCTCTCQYGMGPNCDGE